MTSDVQLYSSDEMDAAIRRIAEAILIAFPAAGRDYALVGLYQQGVPLAERLAREISDRSGFRPDTGKLDITMYRDDFGKRSGLPLIRETVIPFDINGKKIILVDDVLSSGRTIRAALDALTDFGRPGLIRLAVLVDRGNPEFPIRADFSGFRVELPPDHKVVVSFGEDGVPAGITQKAWLHQ